MKPKTYLLSALLLMQAAAYAQCDFTTSGTGSFDGSNYALWSPMTQTADLFSQESVEIHGGTHAMKVDVFQDHSWGTRTFHACDIALSQQMYYVATLWVKGTPGLTLDVTLQQHDGGTAVEITETEITLASSTWEQHVVPLRSDYNYNKGRIKLTFKKTGTYYVDDLTLEEKSDPGVVMITPDDTNIRYSGVIDADISSTKATLYRFQKDYAISEVSGYYTSLRACGSAGITIGFKTASPSVKVYFEENLTYAGDLYYHHIAVFKDGVFQNAGNDLDFNVTNASGQPVFWEFTLPTYSQMDLLKIELSAGYDLLQLPADDRPVYIAIGNSITNGFGQTGNSTHLAYPFLVADSLNHQLYNWGIGGSKVYDGVLENLQSGVEPNLVTILWGYNDIHYSSSDTHFSTSTFPMYQAILDTLCNRFPDAKIMAILPTFTTSPTNTAVRNIDSLRAGEEQIIQTLQLKYDNLHLVDGWQLTDAGDLADVVHLNDAGARHLADGILDAYQSISVNGRTQKIHAAALTPFPNPASEEIYIPQTGHEQWQIFSSRGQLVLTGNQPKANVDDLPGGLYLLRLNKQCAWFVKK